ncbi:hypothetical protein K435DRAFT_902727 [Dendrothele bispora CBS 962.96]|uniref:Alpha-type protein kinase domain-containing protein n=1 Tax=Dendrothele bispora (strain CBS 962.96) TaxID=1314807 RepID=A0A4S8LX98_DENBC|nr:hypothetical protein K435DRAFT_902727 [Dendrothele bispora CBS 962.96]
MNIIDLRLVGNDSNKEEQEEGRSLVFLVLDLQLFAVWEDQHKDRADSLVPKEIEVVVRIVGGIQVLTVMEVNKMRMEDKKGSPMSLIFKVYGGLLTDAQIMTSPALLEVLYGQEINSDAAAFISGKPTLFGDGNIDKCFKKFPKEHLCNDFCRWMGLQPYATFSSEIEP